MRLLALFAAIWSSLSGALAAADRWLVNVRAEFFQLPDEDARAIIPRLSDPQQAAAAYALLTQGAAAPEGNIRRVAALTAGAFEGERATAHVHEERHYPVEYEQEDPRIGMPMDAPAKLPDATGYPSILFDARDCGLRMEFAGEVHPDGDRLRLECQLEHVVFDRWRRYETAVRPDGMKLFLAQPDFVKRATSVAIHVPPSTPILFASYRVLEKEGTFELHVLTATARRVAGGTRSLSPLVAGDHKSQPPASFAKRDMRMELLTFQLRARDALEVRAQMLNGTMARRALETLIARSGSDAIILKDWQVIPSVVGGRAVTENLREVQYGIEDEVPSPPQSFANELRNYTPDSDREPCIDPLTTFETRNVGTTMEVEAVLRRNVPSGGSNQTAEPPSAIVADLYIGASNVELSHFLRWGVGPHRAGKVSFNFQPQFENRKVSSQFALEHAKPVLLRFSKLPGITDRYEIAILRGFATEK
jgi:hypothetical protein